MKKLILLLFIGAASFVSAQQAYYNDVNLSLEGIELKEELATKITATHTNILSYSDAREALKIVDLIPGQGDNVFLVYGFAPELCPASPSNDNDHRRRDKADFGGGATCEWNREHTYPKSLGTPELGDSGPGADAHMLRACDVQRNGLRDNNKFKEGSGNSHVVSSLFWYPGDEWKGDMARIMMYMYLRYGEQCKPVNVGDGNTVSNDAFMIDLFLTWNAEDPVSEYEEYRNNYMENTSNTYGQGNRNPFIDNPYLATRIWGGSVAEDIWGLYLGFDEMELNKSILIYPNPASDKVFIKTNANLVITNISIYTITGTLVKSIHEFPSQKIDLNALSNGIYFLSINTNKGTLTKKIVMTKPLRN